MAVAVSFQCRRGWGVDDVGMGEVYPWGKIWGKGRTKRDERED